MRRYLNLKRLEDIWLNTSKHSSEMPRSNIMFISNVSLPLIVLNHEGNDYSFLYLLYKAVIQTGLTVSWFTLGSVNSTALNHNFSKLIISVNFFFRRFIQSVTQKHLFRGNRIRDYHRDSRRKLQKKNTSQLSNINSPAKHKFCI